ncbi:hypothetical protein [Curtobacterium sp. MCBD17_028]|uniref:hypothetical protein n=1 Tax=Curtobacterium sp. MCBD17_028 TaxID=2175670 RepID=UPI000DA8BFC1|nr:hypothetical protein [Curtobacterium sp. MCBD17_028]PZE24373.1 hypothetical protein DEI86_12740 [Curtobacterium sp. MCBD17_028]
MAGSTTDELRISRAELEALARTLDDAADRVLIDPRMLGPHDDAVGRADVVAELDDVVARQVARSRACADDLHHLGAFARTTADRMAECDGLLAVAAR